MSTSFKVPLKELSERYNGMYMFTQARRAGKTTLAMSMTKEIFRRKGKRMNKKVITSKLTGNSVYVYYAACEETLRANKAKKTRRLRTGRRRK